MKLITVTGESPIEAVKLADAHAHLWIQPPDGVSPENRVELHDFEPILNELRQIHAAGVTTIIDCQPGGCGRDTRKLLQLSQQSGLQVVCVTGFHLQKYYPPEAWLWSATAEEAADYFVEELTLATRESKDETVKSRAGVIKVGYTGKIEGQSAVLMEAAAEASRQTGSAVLFHTEQGQGVEALIPFFADRGVGLERLYLCHVDKRADEGLHRELASEGVLLGYDTFARPKYDPENTVWKLIPAMIKAGLDDHIAVGLDLASPSLWRYQGGAGIQMLVETIMPRLRREGFDETTIQRMTAKNIAQRLSWQES